MRRLPSLRASTRTYISGEAETRNSPSPRLTSEPYGAGLARRSRSNTVLGESAQPSAKSWAQTTSNRSPRMNEPLARSTSLAYSPLAWSLDRGWAASFGSMR